MITDVLKVVKGVLEGVSREITAQLVLCIPSGAVGGHQAASCWAMASLRAPRGVPAHMVAQWPHWLCL